MQDKVREAIREELARQAADNDKLSVKVEGDRLVIHGPVDLESLSFVVVTGLAGGP